MPAWIHDRAEHILAKNPDMGKSTAFAIATQQSHATGHSPKGYGTAQGKRKAKAKFDTPKDDVQSANPGGLESPKMGSVMVEAFFDELGNIKNAGLLEGVKKVLTTPIPGTPEIFPHAAIEAAGRFGKTAPATLPAVAKKTPQDWRANRAAAWKTP
jgi:hypothetical protein